MLQVALLLLPTIVEDGSNTVHEARIAALEAKIARLTDEKTPLPNVPSAGYTRAGPGMGRVGKHAQTPDQQRRLTEDVLSFADEYGSINTTMDHTWILLAGLLCWFLQGGFALLEAGAVRAKNAKNIALKNTMDACIGGVVYYIFGYAFAYGSPGDGTGNPFAGGETAGAFMLNDPPAGFDEYYGFFFQYVFAATIATIVSGAVAERITFKAYMLYAAVLTGLIYPICSHWIWSADGFLNKMGVIDYAGGGAVHALSGVAAFIGAAALGPRIGRFDANGKPCEIKPHNASMMAFGLFVLWFGFIPFNAGSGVSVLGWMAGQTARIAVMTTMGGCSGGVTALLYGLCPEKFGGVGYPSLEYSINGVLSGMVAVCGCCAVVPIWSVFWFISPIAVASFFINMKINEKLKVDDPLGASALHYGPGVVGVIMVGLFGTDDLTSNAYGYTYGEWRDHGAKEDYIGIFMGGNGTQLGYQIAAIAIYSVYGLVTCGILFYGMKFCGILRVPEEDEKIGLDASHHGGPAYILSSDELEAVTTKGVEVSSP